MKHKVLLKVNSIARPIYGEHRYISGIGRSTMHLIDAIYNLNKNELSFDLELYASGISCLGINGKNLNYPYYQFLIPQRFGNRMSNIESFYVKKVLKPSILHIPHNYDSIINKVPSIVTIHDTYEYDNLIRIKNKDNNCIKNINNWVEAVNNSVGIVTCSQASKNDIINRFNVKSEKITVIHWGVSRKLFRILTESEIDTVLKKFKIYKPYFLAVSCAHERKNIKQLLKSFKLFSEKNKDINLYLLWSQPAVEILKEYAELINNGRIQFLKYVRDIELVALYNGALCTMFPSKYEGFGFPIIESYACGTPVMTCRNSSLVEIGGPLADYVGEDNCDEMIFVMEKYSQNHNKSTFQRNIASYVDNFNWSNKAAEYINLYQKYL